MAANSQWYVLPSALSYSLSCSCPFDLRASATATSAACCCCTHKICPLPWFPRLISFDVVNCHHTPHPTTSLCAPRCDSDQHLRPILAHPSTSLPPHSTHHHHNCCRNCPHRSHLQPASKSCRPLPLSPRTRPSSLPNPRLANAIQMLTFVTLLQLRES